MAGRSFDAYGLWPDAKLAGLGAGPADLNRNRALGVWLESQRHLGRRGPKQPNAAGKPHVPVADRKSMLAWTDAANVDYDRRPQTIAAQFAGWALEFENDVLRRLGADFEILGHISVF